MKKNLFAFFLGTVAIFLILPRLYSEENGETDVLKFTYHFEEPRTFSSGEYAGISIAGLKQYRDVGKPILPCKTVKILLPHGRTYSGVTVKAGEMKSIEGSYLIAPGQSPYISQTEPIPPDPEVYSSAGPYPAEVFKVVTLQNKKGYRILYVNLFPVKYIPSRRKLSWYSEIELEVTTRAAPVAPGYRGLAKDRRLVAKQVENRKTAESYPLKVQSH